MNGLNQAIFLDRDGTLNQDPGYLSSPEQVVLLPGVGLGLQLLQKAGFLLIVVSNQSGVARGLIDPARLPDIHQRLESLLFQGWGVRIQGYGLCYHHPEQGCACRKPQPKLIWDLAKQFQVGCRRSYLIGDRETDIQAGQAAGCLATVLIQPTPTPGPMGSVGQRKTRAHFVAHSLLTAARWILIQEQARISWGNAQIRVNGR